MADIEVDTTATIPTVANTDSIIFRAGGVAAVNNVDHSALADGLTSVLVAEAWTGDIGTASAPLKGDVDQGAAMFRYAAGGGACWYQPAGNSNVCTTLRNVSYGTITLLGGGTVTNLETGRGRTIVGSAVTATTIRTGGGTTEVIGTAGAAPTTVHIAGGHYRTQRGATTINLYEGSALIECVTNAITTINIYGGSLNIQHSGTITNLNFYAGDARNIKVGRKVTITNTEIYASVRNASALIDNTTYFTFTNTPTWRIDQGNNY